MTKASAEQAEANVVTAVSLKKTQEKMEKQAEANVDTAVSLEKTQKQLHQYIEHSDARHDKSEEMHAESSRRHDESNKKHIKSDRRLTITEKQIKNLEAEQLIAKGPDNVAQMILDRVTESFVSGRARNMSIFDRLDYKPTMARFLYGYFERLKENPKLCLFIFSKSRRFIELEGSDLHLDLLRTNDGELWYPVLIAVECEVPPTGYVCRLENQESRHGDAGSMGQLGGKTFFTFEGEGMQWEEKVPGVSFLIEFDQSAKGLNPDMESVIVPLMTPSLAKKLGVLEVPYEHKYERSGVKKLFHVSTPFFGMNAKKVAEEFVEDNECLQQGDSDAVVKSIKTLLARAKRELLGTLEVVYKGIAIASDGTKADVTRTIEDNDEVLDDSDFEPIADLIREARQLRESMLKDAIDGEKSFFDAHVREVAEAKDMDVVVVEKCLEAMKVNMVYPEYNESFPAPPVLTIGVGSGEGGGNMKTDLYCSDSYGKADGVF